MSVRQFLRDPLITIANHARLLIATFAVTVLGAAGLYSVIEPYTFLQGLEWATYMTTSTGLGSYGATTAAGQIMGVVLMIWGPVIMVALITGFVVNALREDPNAFTDAEQIELLEGTRRITAYLDSLENAKRPGEPEWKNPRLLA